MPNLNAKSMTGILRNIDISPNVNKTTRAPSSTVTDKDSNSLNNYWASTYDFEQPWYVRAGLGALQIPVLAATLFSGLTGCSEQKVGHDLDDSAENDADAANPNEMEVQDDNSSEDDGLCSGLYHFLKASTFDENMVYGSCPYQEDPENPEQGENILVIAHGENSPLEMENIVMGPQNREVPSATQGPVWGTGDAVQVNDQQYIWVKRNLNSEDETPDELVFFDKENNTRTPILLEKFEQDGKNYQTTRVASLLYSAERKTLYALVSPEKSSGLLNNVLTFQFDGQQWKQHQTRFGSGTFPAYQPVSLALGGSQHDQLLIISKLDASADSSLENFIQIFNLDGVSGQLVSDVSADEFPFALSPDGRTFAYIKEEGMISTAQGRVPGLYLYSKNLDDPQDVGHLALEEPLQTTVGNFDNKTVLQWGENNKLYFFNPQFGYTVIAQYNAETKQAHPIRLVTDLNCTESKGEGENAHFEFGGPDCIENNYGPTALQAGLYYFNVGTQLWRTGQ